MTSCAIVNQSKHLTNADVAKVLPAVNHWSKMVDAVWECAPTICHLSGPTAAVAATFGAIYLLDGLDEPGAAGYHDVIAGRPVGKVDVAGTIAAGMSWTVTLTHELAEMKVDPWCTAAAQFSRTSFVALELCDPVEDDDAGITVDGVRCSNFVWPSYFAPGSKGPWDQRSLLRGPAPSMLSGGYLSVWQSGTWSQAVPHGEHLSDRHRRRHALRVAMAEEAP